ncbi:MAG: PIN domain-containing protein [Gemmatimonadales bacterium]|nr:PIN domain-containing protein [Gemmatimonadales bacterium]MDG2239816.1 PIN domain-containing protein [Longimicrobiales bacterium]NCG33612.1 PIN domain-containing protein [Pseudomonadota bacterium]MBT3499320.1 PIN domain-containing protein [Gemmatimonadales bacterium]MBT3775911.1 PIN domain-containing protein [Gemmatimonadales bacterium]
MRLLVDTSVWSLAFRNNAPSTLPKIRRLAQALREGEQVFTTGLVLQELLQGFPDDEARDLILERFSVLPHVVPDGRDYVDAAELRRRLASEGLRIGTIDALLAQLCLRHDLTLLTTDLAFNRVAEMTSLSVVRGGAA